MQTKETTTMKTTTTIAAVGITLLAAAMSAAIAADTAQPAAAGQPNADAILKAMSDKLGNAQHFSFKATREIAAALAEAHVLPAKCDIEVTVQRPNNVFGTSTSKDGERRLYFNGKDLTMFDGKNNMYSTVPMKSSLDGLPTQLAEKYGFVPPLAEFVMSNPYKDMKFRAKTISYAGTEMAGNPPVDCHHLKLAGKLADAELWIGVNDSLPIKMTAKLKGGTRAGTDLNIEFTRWNLDAPVTDQTFVFTPPADSHRIPMVTSAEAQATKKSDHSTSKRKAIQKVTTL